MGRGSGKGVELNVDKGFSDMERIQILNNSFKNKAELILKVPAAAHMTDKQIKNILDHKHWGVCLYYYFISFISFNES